MTARPSAGLVRRPRRLGSAVCGAVWAGFVAGLLLSPRAFGQEAAPSAGDPPAAFPLLEEPAAELDVPGGLPSDSLPSADGLPPEFLTPDGAVLPADDALYGGSLPEDGFLDGLTSDVRPPLAPRLRWLLILPWRLAGFGREPGARDIGLGNPLVGTSWLNRPYFVGGFAGAHFGNGPLTGFVEQGNNTLTGLRLGMEFGHFWGGELRFARADLNLTYPALAQAGPTGLMESYDLNLVYYPWGDARWRPFASLGLGYATYTFTDDTGQPFKQALFTIPLGVGVKYFLRPWLTLRLDFTEYFVFGGGGLESMQNAALMGGAELRFGGRRRVYGPYSPGFSLW